MINKWLPALFLFIGLHCDAASEIDEEAAYIYQRISTATSAENESVSENLSISGLKNSALSYGSQGGFYITMKRILKYLEEQDVELIYDFKPLMIEHAGFVLLPAKVTISTGNTVITDTVARQVAFIPKIQSQPRFVSALPTWRDYFKLELKPPVINRVSVLPNTDEEVGIWKNHVAKGWKIGEAQAYKIYERRIARLTDDIKGYALYHVLKSKNMITEPQFSSDFYAITGGGSSMSIDEVIVRVTVNPSLIGNRDLWETIPELPRFLRAGAD